MTIDMNAIASRQGGGARHLAPFVCGLAALLPDTRFRLFASAQRHVPVAPPNVEIAVVDIPPGVNLRRIWWDQVSMRRVSRDARLLISPLNFGTIGGRAPHVVFERNPSYFDNRYLSTLGRTQRAKLFAYRAFADACVRSADRVIVPSHAMLDLIRSHGVNTSHARVVPHGFDADEAVRSADRPLVAAADPWTRREVRLLHVSHPAPHKNLPFLADLMASLARRGVDVGLAVTWGAGPLGPAEEAFLRRARELDVLERFTPLGTLPMEDVFPVMANASVMVYPSLTESFGFPILEGLALGLGVVASDIPSNRETGGDAASYHRLDDIEAAADLVEVIAADRSPEAQERRRAHARTFSWAEHCKSVLDVMREVVPDV